MVLVRRTGVIFLRFSDKREDTRDTTGLPSSFCVVDCALNDFIGDQISLSKGDALGF